MSTELVQPNESDLRDMDYINEIITRDDNPLRFIDLIIARAAGLDDYLLYRTAKRLQEILAEDE